MVAEGQVRHMKENQMKKGSEEKESEGPQLLSTFSESRAALHLNNSTAGRVPPASPASPSLTDITRPYLITG